MKNAKKNDVQDEQQTISKRGFNYEENYYFWRIMLRLSTNVSTRLFQADQLATHYGGAEANVGVSLSHFGHDVYFVSKVPENSLGRAVESTLKTQGVHTNYLIKGGERLGTYYLETGVGQRSSQVTYDRAHSSFPNWQSMRLTSMKFFLMPYFSMFPELPLHCLPL